MLYKNSESFKQLFVNPNVLDTYKKKLSNNAFLKDTIFSVSPFDSSPKDDPFPWYSLVPVGKNILAMCQNNWRQN